jgi:hypothetical protein
MVDGRCGQKQERMAVAFVFGRHTRARFAATVRLISPSHEFYAL